MSKKTASKKSYKPYVYKRAEDLGIPVIEAMERVFVTVTDNDVVNAQKANSKHCALARAALRLPGVVAAYFFRKTAFIEYPDQMIRFLLPSSVQKEIVSFDRAQVFASGIYQLTPPAPSETRKGKAKDNKRRRSGGKPVKPSRPMTKREQAGFLAAQKAAMGPGAFAKKVSVALSNHVNHIGDRTVSGVKRADAPEPLPGRAPTRYVHRTQYVRDIREPAASE